MNSRRKAMTSIAATGDAEFLPTTAFSKDRNKNSSFRYCLNTSTVMGQQLGIQKYVEITADAGYDGIEVWIRDLKQYTEAGN